MAQAKNKRHILLTTSATDTGAAVEPLSKDRTFQATAEGAGSVSATVVVEASNEDESGPYITLGTISVSGTTSASDGFASDANWVYVRARCTAISASTTLSVVMGN